MKFRNYCIVVMGKIGEVSKEIIKVAEGKPKILDGTGVFICTFTSMLKPIELEEYFKREGRSFFIFDLDKENSGYHLHGINAYNHLFGDIISNKDKLKDMTDKMKNEISGTTNEINTVITPAVKNKRKISDMTREERQKLVDRILDKGPENFTEQDKLILKKLSEYR